MQEVLSKTSSDPIDAEVRKYDPARSAAFRKTMEKFGALSNMAAGFPLVVAGIEIRTSEALYQACRFPHLPHLQELIIEQDSPMTAKMKSKPFRDQSREDWERVRVPIMRWCLRVKLVQNWERFSGALESTEERPIVEDSRRDDFWGAVASEHSLLVGRNVLGRLLMELRGLARTQALTKESVIEPLRITGFSLLGREIGPVTSRDIAAIRTISRTKSLFD